MNNKVISVPVDFLGQRADVALAQLFPHYSRSQLSQWLKSGMITVNGAVIKPKDKLKGGETIVLALEDLPQIDTALEAEAIPLDIIFEDEEVLLVNKPAGLVVHPGAGNPKHTLVNALLYHQPELQQLPRAGIIHRLDKDTTGLLLVAKSHAAHTSLIRQMQAREIDRRYYALVYGHIIVGATIKTAYGRHPRNRLKMAVCQHGKEAVTEYSVKTHYAHMTLLDVKLWTGRTHQIRVHMAHINRPIVGDPLYGGRVRFPKEATLQLKDALQQFQRQALHAYSLSFSHPKSLKRLTLTAPLPDDFKHLLNVLDEDID